MKLSKVILGFTHPQKKLPPRVSGSTLFVVSGLPSLEIKKKNTVALFSQRCCNRFASLFFYLESSLPLPTPSPGHAMLTASKRRRKLFAC